MQPETEQIVGIIQRSQILNLFQMWQRTEDGGDVVDIDLLVLVHDSGPELVYQLVATLLLVRVKRRQDVDGFANLDKKYLLDYFNAQMLKTSSLL